MSEPLKQGLAQIIAQTQQANERVEQLQDLIAKRAAEMEIQALTRKQKLERQIRKGGIGTHPLLEKEYLKVLKERREAQLIYAASRMTKKALVRPDAPTKPAGLQKSAGGPDPRAADIVIVVIVNDQGQVLVCRRSLTETHRPGEWECPGGHRDPHETLQDAAIREVREETGLNVSLGEGLLCFKTREGKDLTMLTARIAGGELRLKLDEHDLAAWLYPHELGKLKPAPPRFAANVREVLRQRKTATLRKSGGWRNQPRDEDGKWSQVSGLASTVAWARLKAMSAAAARTSMLAAPWSYKMQDDIDELADPGRDGWPKLTVTQSEMEQMWRDTVSHPDAQFGAAIHRQPLPDGTSKETLQLRCRAPSITVQGHTLTNPGAVMSIYPPGETAMSGLFRFGRVEYLTGQDGSLLN